MLESGVIVDTFKLLCLLSAADFEYVVGALEEELMVVDRSQDNVDLRYFRYLELVDP